MYHRDEKNLRVPHREHNSYCKAKTDINAFVPMTAEPTNYFAFRMMLLIFIGLTFEVEASTSLDFFYHFQRHLISKFFEILLIPLVEWMLEGVPKEDVPYYRRIAQQQFRIIFTSSWIKLKGCGIKYPHIWREKLRKWFPEATVSGLLNEWTLVTYLTWPHLFKDTEAAQEFEAFIDSCHERYYNYLEKLEFDIRDQISFLEVVSKN